MKATEIREFTQDELARALEENQRELFNLRLQAKTGQLENTARIKQVRKDIARIKTEHTARIAKEAQA